MPSYRWKNGLTSWYGPKCLDFMGSPTRVQAQAPVQDVSGKELKKRPAGLTRAYVWQCTGVEGELLGQTLPISAVDKYGIHINFGPERGYAELSVEEWADQLVWPKMSGLHGVSGSGSGSGSSSECERWMSQLAQLRTKIACFAPGSCLATARLSRAAQQAVGQRKGLKKATTELTKAYA